MQETAFVLPVGSMENAILVGGPLPWFDDPSSHYTKLENGNPDVIRIERDVQASNSAEIHDQENKVTIKDHHVIKVTCLALGEAEFALIVGNTATQSNR